MTALTIQIEAAKQTELDNINQVIEAAVMQWDLAERVKRLSLPSYFYNALDLKHFEIRVAKQSGKIVAVVAWEQADIKDMPEYKNNLLIHGLYVHPDRQNQGIAKKLLQAAENAARSQSFSGLLVKAQKDAVGYFIKNKFKAITVDAPASQYANTLWRALEDTPVIPA